MAGLIEVFGNMSGLNLYAIIRKQGQLWNGSAFETFNAANWGNYDIPLSEQGVTSYYFASFPAGITTVAKYTICVHQRIGGSPDPTDPAYSPVAIQWDGSAEEQGIGAVLQSFNLDKIAYATASGSPPAQGSWLDIMMSKNSGQTYSQATDSLEALADTGGGGPTASQIADAVWDEALDSSHTTADTAGERLRAIDNKLPSGNISDFDETTNSVNLNSSQSGVTIGTVNELGTSARSQINSEIADVLFTDTINELSSGVPASTPTIANALMLLYMMVRNKHTATASEEKIFNNAGAAVAKATVSDNGTTFTKDQFGAP